MLRVAAEKNKFTVLKLTPEEWARMSEDAHLTVFEEKRPVTMDRIDYALLVVDEEVPCGYLTARELDSESVYWQFGGAFPGTRGSSKVLEVYSMMLDWTFKKYKRVTTLVENTNIRYLKLAMHCGFRIIGCRFFENKILVELLNQGSKGE